MANGSWVAISRDKRSVIACMYTSGAEDSVIGEDGSVSDIRNSAPGIGAVNQPGVSVVRK